MSEFGFQHTTGSSSIGLTFIRPMPQGGSASHHGGASHYEGEGSSVRGPYGLGIAERLFPPRSLDDSGVLPAVAGLELGHFLIEERIGRGGMGAVFRATDKRLGRTVAVKVLNAEHSSDPEAVLRFQNEARAAARLDHENISRVFYIGEEHGLHFIAFEFVMGTNVRNFILQKGQLAPVDAVNYTLQIAEALRHTDAAKVVHRDIKPSNIIITPTGRAKLVDLGLARHINPETSRELTTVGTALGTFDYIAPEQAMDARNVDVRSDIYSLGCTLYHMLTGSPPYPTGTMFEKVMNHHRPVPPNPSTSNRQVSPQLARVVQKMMAANPDERYANADALIADLVLIADALGLEPTIPDARVWQVPLMDRRSSRWNGIRTWTSVAMILVVVVLADRLRSLTPSHEEVVTQSDDSLSGTLGMSRNTHQSPIATPSIELGENAEINIPVPAVSTDPLAPQPNVEAVFRPFESWLHTRDYFNPSTLTNSGTLGSPGILSQSLESSLPNLNGTPSQTAPSTSPASTERATTPLRTEGPPASAPVMPVASAPSVTPSPADSPNTSANASMAPATPPGRTTSSVNPPTSVGTEPVAPPVVKNDGFVVVKPATQDGVEGEERISRPTLAAACALAKDGWAIELPLNTPLLLQETLNISDKKIKIRPSREYRPGVDPRPILRVDLTAQLAMGTLSRTTQMLLINRGAVDLFDIDVEMVIDSALIADWSVVTLLNGSRLTTQGVSFTIVNPGGSRATLVNIPAGQDSNDMGELMPERMVPRHNRIEMKDTLCRGQFDFITQQGIAPLNINLQNSAFVLTGAVLRIDGSDSFIMSMDVEEARITELILDQVTLVAARGLVNANSGDHGSLPQIKLEMNNSICSILSDVELRQPLLEVAGHEEYELLVDKITFKENRDPTFLELSGPFSLFDSSTSQLPGFGREMAADQLGARNIRVSDLPLLKMSPILPHSEWHQVQRSDLELNPDDHNPAIGAGGDLRNAGVNWLTSRLPGASGQANEE